MNLVMDGRRDGELRAGTRFPKFTAVPVCNVKSCGMLAALSWSRGRLGTAEWMSPSFASVVVGAHTNGSGCVICVTSLHSVQGWGCPEWMVEARRNPSDSCLYSELCPLWHCCHLGMLLWGQPLLFCGGAVVLLGNSCLKYFIGVFSQLVSVAWCRGLG